MYRIGVRKKIFLLLLMVCHTTTMVYATDYSISLSTSGQQTINVSSGGTGTSIGADNITVTTDCRYGYNLALSTSTNNNNLYLNGNISNNTPGTFFSPSDGTTALSSAPNTWGYYYDSSSATAPTSSSVFSAIPTSSNATIIKTPLTNPSSTDIEDSFNVYYGVSVSGTLAPGTYKMIPDTNNNNADGTIVYQALIASDCMPYIVQFNPTSTSTGSSLSGTGSMSNQEILKNVATNLTYNAFTPPAGYEFKEWNTSQDGTGTSYIDGESVTNLAAPGSTITLYAIWRLPPPTLYNAVASMTKGTLAENNISLSDTVTTPTSTDRNEDTSNSGVFTYDSNVYGVSSDASNSYPIYFYRGILEETPGTYSGSEGSSITYPNYVKLDNNTCWRIIRTTGSGGVKMIYNGTYGSTTSKSCANSSGAKVSIQTNIQYNTIDLHNKHAVGYTYNSNMNGETSSYSVDVLFGSNSDPSLNDTRSNYKTYIEDTWYPNNMTSYTSMLEPSAGYCNDRTLYTSASTSPTLITATVPYENNTSIYRYFGSYERTVVSGGTPSLTCPRNVVDLYRYVPGSEGLGNELKYPAALITADEQRFAGLSTRSSDRNNQFVFLSPSSTTGSNSGNGGTPTLSPSGYFMSNATMISLFADSDHWYHNEVKINKSAEIRPVISLIHNIYIASGSGTATDPWLITDEEPVPTINLYDAVADMSKGTQTASELQASSITASNSGVYEYNSSVFGADTDGTKRDNTKATIYYYRGILDTNLDGTSSTYGSNGNGEAYPNYVKLNNTCWRIIRTTGSGGVKMIYNGLFSSGTTANSCANATTNAQISSPVSTSTFNGTASNASMARQVVRVGYTHNSSYASTSASTSTAFTTVFGSDSNYSVNNTNSTIKGNIESWYNSNLTAYTSILEPNASYCNDRQSFTTSTGTTATSSIRPYTTSTNTGATYVAYFGAYQRNATTAKLPSLACPRSTVDNYSTSTSKGNGQLSAPVALITADEASFAGSGRNTASQGSYYNANSFLRSGSDFWTMSPYYRYSSYAHNFYLNATGYVQNARIDTAYGIRPVISLKEGTEAVSGSGTATDPWVVEAP